MVCGHCAWVWVISCRHCKDGRSVSIFLHVTQGSEAYIRQILTSSQTAARAVLGAVRGVVIHALDGDVLLAEYGLQCGDEGRPHNVAQVGVFAGAAREEEGMFLADAIDDVVAGEVRASGLDVGATMTGLLAGCRWTRFYRALETRSCHTLPLRPRAQPE